MGVAEVFDHLPAEAEVAGMQDELEYEFRLPVRGGDFSDCHCVCCISSTSVFTM